MYMNRQDDFLRVLKDTSRTFFIPIVRLPQRLQEAVGSAYLCMRAIDEIVGGAEALKTSFSL